MIEVYGLVPEYCGKTTHTQEAGRCIFLSGYRFAGRLLLQPGSPTQEPVLADSRCPAKEMATMNACYGCSFDRSYLVCKRTVFCRIRLYQHDIGKLSKIQVHLFFVFLYFTQKMTNLTSESDICQLFLLYNKKMSRRINWSYSPSVEAKKLVHQNYKSPYLYNE
jgi:hypothetical protein